MNRQYAFKDENTVFVSNEKGNLTEEKFTTNFDEIKIQENVVEEIENNLKMVSNSKEKWVDNMKSSKKLMKLGPFLGISAGASVALVGSLLQWSFDILSCLRTISLGLAFGTIFTALIYSEYRVEKKHFNLAHFQSYFLGKDLERENKKLQELREKCEPIQHKEENSIVQINDRKQLEELKTYFECLRKYGEDLPRQASLYAHGLWEEKQKEQIANDGLDTIAFAEYLNEYNTNKLTRNKKIS